MFHCFVVLVTVDITVHMTVRPWLHSHGDRHSGHRCHSPLLVELKLCLPSERQTGSGVLGPVGKPATRACLTSHSEWRPLTVRPAATRVWTQPVRGFVAFSGPDPNSGIRAEASRKLRGRHLPSRVFAGRGVAVWSFRGLIRDFERRVGADHRFVEPFLHELRRRLDSTIKSVPPGRWKVFKLW